MTDISIIIPCSPIPSHPSTAILDETLDSVRHHLPDAELFVTFDGVRVEQEARRGDYDEFVRRALWRLDKHYGGAVPYVWSEHLHQVGMLRRILDDIDTPLMLWCESDTPLVTDEPIDWDSITDFILSGRSNCTRLHHESVIPKAHSHMMHGEEDGYIRTSQYSARPHIATTAFYRQLLEHFTPDANCFIEDKAHGVIDEAYRIDGMAGWNMWRLHIYAKDPNNLKRSYHLDARAGEPKWDEKQVF